MTVRTQVMDSSAADDFAFEHYEVVTGSANRQTVLTGFLLGGAFRDLAVVNIDGNDARRLRIYAFNASTWVPNLGRRSVPKCCSSMLSTSVDVTG